MDMLLPALFALAHGAVAPGEPPRPPLLLVAAEEEGKTVRRVPIIKNPVEKQPGTVEKQPTAGTEIPKLPRSSIPAPPPPAPPPPPSGGGAKVPGGPDGSDCSRRSGQKGWDGCK